jgi:hypothetical protein
MFGRIDLRDRRTQLSVISLVISLVIIVLAAVALPSSTTATKSNTTSSGSNYNPSSGLSPSGTASSSPGATGSSSSSATIGSGGQAVGGPGKAPGVPGVTSKHLSAVGPGVTDKTIYVGLAYSSQSASGDRAIGAAGAAPSYDLRNVWNTMINYANTHGGFAGRILKPLYVDIKITQDVSAQEQAACAYWTQDNKVFALPGGNDILDSCAEKAKAVAIGSGSATTATFKKYPHMIDPDGIANDRLGQLTVTGLHDAKYFTATSPWTKDRIGLVTWDDPAYRSALQTGYIDTMSKYGLKPYCATPGDCAIAYISVPQQIGALGDMTAAVSSAVAKFKGLGVDHVMIQDGPAGVWAGDGLTFEWEQQSKSQGYFPRYGGNDGNAPGFTVNPHDEEDRGLFVSTADYDKRYDVGWHTNATREECFKIQSDAGYPPQNDNDEGIAAGVCDAVFFVQTVVNSSSELSNDAFISASEKLGKSFPSALVYGTNLFPGRHDGGDMVRTAEYFNSCKCLKYQGPPVYAD